MAEQNLCLEEYIELLRNYSCDGPHLQISANGKDYEVYFCSGMTAYVPVSGNYSISGNNVDGFIVTIEK